MSKSEKAKLTCTKCKSIEKTENQDAVPTDLLTLMDPPDYSIQQMLNSMEKRITNLFTTQMKALTQTLSEVEAGMSFINEKFEEHKQQVEAVEKKQNENSILISELMKQNQVLQEKMELIQEEVVQLQQRSRIQNIEIAGYPETKNENLIEILENVAAQIGITTFNPNSVNVIHRVNTRNSKCRPIIVNFYSRQVRYYWISQGRKNNGFSTTTISPNLPQSKIYVGEHLCPANKILPRGEWSVQWSLTGVKCFPKMSYLLV